jgi:hypothetical protein
MGKDVNAIILIAVVAITAIMAVYLSQQPPAKEAKPVEKAQPHVGVMCPNCAPPPQCYNCHRGPWRG